MAQGDPLVPLPDIRLGIYRHYKGQRYELIGVALHSETHEALVVYRPLYGEGALWVQPHGMFIGTVQVDGIEQPRFALEAVRYPAGAASRGSDCVALPDSPHP